MKVPWIPLAVAATLVVIVVLLFNSMSSGRKVMGAARVERLVDVDGTETEVTMGRPGG